MIKNIEFVIAKYKEDISWLDILQPNRPYKVTIYDKSEGGDLPNIGREAHTYLHHIITNYNNLADTTVFLQGHPFDHVTRKNRINIPKEELGELIKTYPFSKTEPFFTEFTHTLSDANDACERVFGYNPGSLTFTGGALWIVQKEDILARPVEFYQKLLKENIDDPNACISPWSLERTWHLIFNPSIPISKSFMEI